MAKKGKPASGFVVFRMIRGIPWQVASGPTQSKTEALTLLKECRAPDSFVDYKVYKLVPVEEGE